jgi:signal transduction histidine kinase/CheY-like chemotaxis protein
MEEDNYPTTFYNSQERQWQGIAVDILAEISDLSGITFRTANRITDNFPDLLDMVKRGEVAMIGELVRTFRREGSFIWSARPYASDYYALLSRSDYNDVSINNIPYARVGLIANATVYADIFREWFPYHPNTVEYPSLYQGFEALEQGEIDLLMASRNLLLTITHYHERPGFKANYIFAQSYDSLFAFNKNETILCSVVNKAQSFINTQQIVERWIRRVFDYQGTLARSQRPYLVGLSVLLFVVLGLLTIMLVRNKQMKKYLEETVSKRTEELEIQTKLAEAASEAKSQFLASMSHEIRTPMNAIIGMSDLMRTDNLDQVQLGYFNDIKKMAKALLQIINDILDFSKIEAGKMELFPVHYSVSSLFDNICSMSTFTAMAKELEFRHSFDPRLPSVLYGDEVRVRQVVTNIVNNAVKYTREGYVYLKADRVSRNGAEWVAFMVQDSGLGIKKEDLPKLFGKFQQFDSRKNRGIVGTGLGLSITKNLVEMMGGEIEVESEYEKGSIFRVYLPLVEGDEGLIEHTHATGRVLAQEGVRILVVDDNSINLTVALGFLATHNIAADTALSGPAAIQMVQQKQYDLVFMDHMMPEMDGIEATTRIRALDGVWYKNMPIIALSANAVSGARESFLAGGMNDFISKPIDTEQLNLTLLKWLPPEKIAGTVPVPEAGQGDGEKPQEVDPEAGPLKELTDIAGLDLRTGLSHVGNDQGTYITILRQFCKEFPDYVAEIQRFRAEENWKEYSIRLHGIKGVLANMGMEKLSQWAYQLEQASKGEDYAVCREETEGICEALYQFWDALRRTAVLDAGEALQREPVEGAVLWETLDALADACRTGESEKADRLAGELDRIGSAGVEEAALKEISELVASLDYDVVVEKIATLREA